MFEYASLAPLSLAWEAFGTANGSPTLADMRAVIARLKRSRSLGEREDPTIGYRILAQPFFWPPERWMPAPADFSANTAVGKGLLSRGWRRPRALRAVQERLAVTPQAPGTSTGDRFGVPVLMQCRLGQGAFRTSVTDGYARRCAVSGERTLPILDAAHIRSYADPNGHRQAVRPRLCDGDGGSPLRGLGAA